MPLQLTHFEVIYKEKVEYEILERYQQEIKELEALGFSELHFTREVAFPLSVLFFFWVYPLLKLNKEVYRIEMPLRYVLLNPLLLNRQYDTYAHVFNMGTKFGTLFADGTLLITNNYSSTNLVKPENKIYRYSQSKKTSIQSAWDEHIKHIEDIETKGRETNPDLSIENFEKIVNRDNKAILFGR